MTRWALALAGTLVGCFDGGGGASEPSATRGAAPPSAARALRVRPAHLDFGAVPVGTRVAQQVEVANAGSTPLQLLGARVGLGGPQFSAAAQPTRIEPGEHVFVEVTLDGRAHGRVVGDLVVQTDHPSRPETHVVLLADVVAPPCVEIGPDPLELGSTLVGRVLTGQVWLRPCGGATPVAERIRVEPGGVFEVSPPLRPPFNVDRERLLTVGFRPLTAGQSSATVQVEIAGLGAPLELRVTGTAQENRCPEARLVPASVRGPEDQWIRLTAERSEDPDGPGGRPQRYTYRVEQGDDLEFSEDGARPDDPTTAQVHIRGTPGNRVVQVVASDERSPEEARAQCPEATALARVRLHRDPLPELEVQLSWRSTGMPDPRRAGPELVALLRHPDAGSWSTADPLVAHAGPSGRDFVWDPPDGDAHAVEGDTLGTATGRRAIEVVDPPAPGGYGVAVHYARRYDPDGFDYGLAQARLRILSSGEVLLDRQLTMDQDMLWHVADYLAESREAVGRNELFPAPP